MHTTRAVGHTARQESEMAAESLHSLDMEGSTTDPLKRLRLMCLSHGGHGILHVGRMFRRMEQEKNSHITFEDFSGALRDKGMELAEEDCGILFKRFKNHHSGDTLNLTDFLMHLRPKLSEQRKRVIDEAFNKMDAAEDGVITFKDLKKHYNVKAHPRYVAGVESEDFILNLLLKDFEHGGTEDGKITHEEFVNYYSAISASIQDDCYFDLMMRQAFGL